MGFFGGIVFGRRVRERDWMERWMKHEDELKMIRMASDGWPVIKTDQLDSVDIFEVSSI